MSKRKHYQGLPIYLHRSDSTQTPPHQSERPASTSQMQNPEETLPINKNSRSNKIVTACEKRELLAQAYERRELALFRSMIPHSHNEPPIQKISKTLEAKLEKKLLYIKPENVKIEIENVQTFKHEEILKLQDLCLLHPHALVRNLTYHFNLNLDLFDIETIKRGNPNAEIDCLIQTHQDPVSPKKGQPNWISPTERKIISLSEYLSDLYTVRGKVTLGSNIDLPEHQYSKQYDELNKLPAFCKVNSNEDMLSQIGYSIGGINTVQVFMMVSGSRRTGWLENNSFCSVNINTGPEACEWFVVSHEYSSVIKKLCKKKKLSLSNSSWWPNIEELKSEGVPVSQFLQEKNDMVWINAGGIQWVESKGNCNHLAWNVGPISHRQYYSALETYEWNKVQHPSVKSLVPMIHLTWNLARNVKFNWSDAIQLEAMYYTMRECLFRSLTNVCLQREFVKKCKGEEPRRRYRKEDEAVLYCKKKTCEIEVFNILYVKSASDETGEYPTYCIDCALKSSPMLKKFNVLESYDFEELCEVYDTFSDFKRWTVSSSNNSSKENTKKSKVDISLLAARQYLDLTVIPALMEGLSSLNRERPNDPLEWLGNYLLKKKSKNGSERK